MHARDATADKGMNRKHNRRGSRAKTPYRRKMQRLLDEFAARRLLLHLNERYLALALREARRIPGSLEEFPGGYTDIEAFYEYTTN